MTSFIEVGDVPGEPLVQMTVEYAGGRWDGLSVDVLLTLDEALLLAELLADACTEAEMLEEES